MALIDEVASIILIEHLALSRDSLLIRSVIITSPFILCSKETLQSNDLAATVSVVRNRAMKLVMSGAGSGFDVGEVGGRLQHFFVCLGT